MEDRNFDGFARAVGADGGTRRGLLRALAALPLAGGLAALLGGDGEAGRRQRRKARHDPGGDKEIRKGKRKGKNQKKVKPCLGGPCFRTPFTIEAQ